MSDKFKGYGHYRVKDNELEAAFAAAWEKENTDPLGRDVPDTLAHILDRFCNERRPQQPSERDYRVAATVIQWLGSPVGSRFVRDVLEAYDEKQKRRR